MGVVWAVRERKKPKMTPTIKTVYKYQAGLDARAAREVSSQGANGSPPEGNLMAPKLGRPWQIRSAMDKLNPYKQRSLREEWDQGFRDSARDYYSPSLTTGRNASVAYGRGWNARRDVHNIERFPVIDFTALPERSNG